MSSPDKLCKKVWTQIRPDKIFFSKTIRAPNRLDLDQAQLNVGPDLDPNCLIFLKELFEKFDFEKNQQTIKKHEKLPNRQRVNCII